MAADLNLLHPDLRPKIVKVFELCYAKGYEFRANFTGRTPWQQARLWRQSRTREELLIKLVQLRDTGCFWTADVLEGVGPQHGTWATNALPGQSWHNWMENGKQAARACDCFLIVKGAAIWGVDEEPGKSGYAQYKTAGESLGLTSLARIHDYGHLQLDAQELTHIYKPADLDALMKEHWGTTEPLSFAASA